jgi:hypothetical protein
LLTSFFYLLLLCFGPFAGKCWIGVTHSVVGNNYDSKQDNEERHMHQMPRLLANFECNYTQEAHGLLKDANSMKLDVCWSWIHDHYRTLNGCKAWQALVGHHDGTTGKLNKGGKSSTTEGK